MNTRLLTVMALALALCACAASHAEAQTGYIRIPQGYRVIPNYPQRYVAPRYVPRYQPVPSWGRSLNVTTPRGLNVHVNPYNGRGAINFRGFRIGF
ncbi:MAG: hypothetical protein ACK528_10965 [Alphaproteobacteria bacterium]